MPKNIKLGTQLANLKKSYAKMEENIPKWIAAEGLTSIIIPQEEYLQEYSMWGKVEFGAILTLRVPFVRQGLKQRLCIYPNRIERQILQQQCSMLDFFNDHNVMLRTNTKITYFPEAYCDRGQYFKNEATFKEALKKMLFLGHMGLENERNG